MIWGPPLHIVDAEGYGDAPKCRQAPEAAAVDIAPSLERPTAAVQGICGAACSPTEWDQWSCVSLSRSSGAESSSSCCSQETDGEALHAATQPQAATPAATAPAMVAAAETIKQPQKRGARRAGVQVVHQSLFDDGDDKSEAERQQQQQQLERRRALSLPSALKASPVGLSGGLPRRNSPSTSFDYKSFGPQHLTLLQQVLPNP